MMKLCFLCYCLLKCNFAVSYNATGVAIKSIGYSYDLDGKRTRKVDNLGSQDYAYNANGQLTTAGVNVYSYDADGRLIQVTKSGNTVTLNHDAYDHLTQVTSNGVTTQYRYDAQGNRIGEVSTNGAKNYLVAPNLGNGLASTDLVTDGSGNVVSDYVYGGSSIIARLDANGEPLYYLTDSMGSVIGLVDGAGNIQSRIVYDGFGNVESGDDGSSLGGDFRFQGQWLESESGLYYMRARDYDSETGLFLSRDAVDVQEQGVEAFNPYQFANGNPLVYSDPTGMFTILELNATISVQDVLQGLKTYAGQQAKDYVIQKIGESFGNVVASALNAFIPGSSILTNVLKGVNSFEDGLKGVICSYFEGLPLKDNLFIDVKIPNGQPINNGLNCAENPNMSPRSYQRTLAQNGSTPDFMFRNSLPLSYRFHDSGAYLVGDVKTFLGAVRINQRNQSQFENMVKYAKQYQALPFVSYITLSDSNLLGKHEPQDKGLSKTDKIRLTEDALARGIILILVSILNR